MSMWPEPEIEDVPVADGTGRYWRHLRTTSIRIDESEALGMDILECGLFLVFDPHQTEAYLALKDASGVTQAVALIGMMGVWDVRGAGDRDGTAEEWRLAEAMGPGVHREVLLQGGFVVEDEPAEGMKP